MTNDSYLERFFAAYVECALWSSSDESTPSGGSPLDENYGPDDFAPEALDSIRAECIAFIVSNARDLCELEPAQAGHDFWLTRNRHGAGFWDRGLGALGARLTEASHPWGESYIYVGDDGSLYVS